jgi:hypothetical protein
MIIIGDLHGHIDLYREIKRQFPLETLVTVGDYVDSQKTTRNQQLRLVKELLQDVESGKTIALLGNHELSYLYPSSLRASGYEQDFADQLKPYFSEMQSKFVKYYILEQHKILITHAGLSLDLLFGGLTDLDLLQQFLSDASTDLDSCLYWIGRARGGEHEVGGIFWCDYNYEFNAIPGIKQVFGHTPSKRGILKLDEENYCIDCLEYSKKKQVLEIDPEGAISIRLLQKNFNKGSH